MIRINLLPVRARQRRAAAQRQVVLLAAPVLVVVLAVLVLHLATSSTLKEVLREQHQLEMLVAQYKAEVGDYDDIRKQREELLKQRDVVRKLQAARTGPVYALRELSDLLTRNRGPTYDRTHYEAVVRRDPNAGYNPAWDTRRAWLEAYEESGGLVKTRGRAKSHEDVAELHKRLDLSVFFEDVQLQQTRQVEGKVKQVAFELTCKVRY